MRVSPEPQRRPGPSTSKLNGNAVRKMPWNPGLDPASVFRVGYPGPDSSLLIFKEEAEQVGLGARSLPEAVSGCPRECARGILIYWMCNCQECQLYGEGWGVASVMLYGR